VIINLSSISRIGFEVNIISEDSLGMMQESSTETGERTKHVTSNVGNGFFPKLKTMVFGAPSEHHRYTIFKEGHIPDDYQMTPKDFFMERHFSPSWFGLKDNRRIIKKLFPSRTIRAVKIVAISRQETVTVEPPEASYWSDGTIDNGIECVNTGMLHVQVKSNGTAPFTVQVWVLLNDYVTHHPTTTATIK
jgi:hypothetical protein